MSTVAYARKQKSGDSSEPPEADEAAKPKSEVAATADLDAKFDVTDRSQPLPIAAIAAAAAAAPTARAKAETLAMPVLAPVGAPPPMPVPARTDGVESPTNMPAPNQIPGGEPTDPAAAPGMVPPGDSRSMRRRDATTYEFALIYRRATYVVTRFGVVGTRGQWRVVEYPTSASASHAYAKECSRFVSEGFSDYRD